MNKISQQDLDTLACLDAPTLSNAIEAFNVRDATSGFASRELIHFCPEQGTMVGYALTCTADTTTPAPRRPTVEWQLFEAVAAAPKPVVVIIKDISSDPLKSCHAGDILSSIFYRLGATGLVTDGGIRDLFGIKERVPQFHVFAAGLVASHGIPTFLEIGVTVTVGGLTIRPGDLLHGDANGLLVVPTEILQPVLEQAKKVQEKERRLVSFINSDEFSLTGLKPMMGH